MIVPAAGKATRFSGLPKELLPTDINECCLVRAVRLSSQLGEPVIITNNEKQPLHETVLRASNLLEGCNFVRQGPMQVELWGAIQLGLERNRAGGVVLADTVTSISAMPGTPVESIAFGVFDTETPERFSVIQSEKGVWTIRTKEKLPSPQKAWGMALWEPEVTNFFLDNKFEHYDRAFEAAASRFGGEMFPLSYYFDLGTFAAYIEFLNLTHLAARADRAGKTSA